EALAACREGLQHYPDDLELLFAEGIMLLGLRDLAGAEASLLRALATQPAPHFASVDAGLRGYKLRHNLAVVYHQQGGRAEAEAQWRAVVAERADFLPAWLGLGEEALARQDWPALEDVTRRLQGLPEGALESAVFRARGHLARREFTAAKDLLNGAIAEAPDALGPRLILSHVHLQEGRDFDAAEKALRAVLLIDPRHPEAANNLAVLLRQRREGADTLFRDNVPLAEAYHKACREPSEGHEHLPTLYAL